jgi:hypothetical protein
MAPLHFKVAMPNTEKEYTGIKSQFGLRCPGLLWPLAWLSLHQVLSIIRLRRHIAFPSKDILIFLARRWPLPSSTYCTHSKFDDDHILPFFLWFQNILLCGVYLAVCENHLLWFGLVVCSRLHAALSPAIFLRLYKEPPGTTVPS